MFSKAAIIAGILTMLLIGWWACHRPGEPNSLIFADRESAMVHPPLATFDTLKNETESDVRNVIDHAVACERSVVFVDMRWSILFPQKKQFSEFASAYSAQTVTPPVMFHYADCTPITTGYRPLKELPGWKQQHASISGWGELIWMANGQVLHVEPIGNSATLAELTSKTDRFFQSMGQRPSSIEHIGSTAIPGILAKPIIDILLVVQDLEVIQQCSADLHRNGFQAKGEYGIPGRRYFRKDHSDGRRWCHVHAFAEGSLPIDHHRNFRDFLIAHPQWASQYCQLKQQLQKDVTSRDAYQEGKAEFIQQVLRLAADWRVNR